jgi:hypothetical protein
LEKNFWILLKKSSEFWGVVIILKRSGGLLGNLGFFGRSSYGFPIGFQKISQVF